MAPPSRALLLALSLVLGAMAMLPSASADECDQYPLPVEKACRDGPRLAQCLLQEQGINDWELCLGLQNIDYSVECWDNSIQPEACEDGQLLP